MVTCNWVGAFPLGVQYWHSFVDVELLLDNDDDDDDELGLLELDSSQQGSTHCMASDI